MTEKQQVMIYIDKTAKAHLEEMGYKLSHFFMDSYNQLIKGDTEAQTKLLVNRIRTLDAERGRLCKELETSTGRKIEEFAHVGVVDFETDEQRNLHRLFDVMSYEQKSLALGKKIYASSLTETQLRNWIDARKDDFEIHLQTDTILQRFRDNGFGEARA